MSVHRDDEQPLEGKAQERCRHEKGPARTGQEQAAGRVTKPWGRNEAGRYARGEWIDPPAGAEGQEPHGSRWTA